MFLMPETHLALMLGFRDRDTTLLLALSSKLSRIDTAAVSVLWLLVLCVCLGSAFQLPRGQDVSAQGPYAVLQG